MRDVWTQEMGFTDEELDEVIQEAKDREEILTELYKDVVAAVTLAPLLDHGY